MLLIYLGCVAVIAAAQLATKRTLERRDAELASVTAELAATQARLAASSALLADCLDSEITADHVASIAVPAVATWA